MAYLIGVLLAAGVVVFAKVVGLDRQRAFYASVLLVVAHYYILFATMDPDHTALIAEIVAALVFIAAAVIGFRIDMRYAAAGLTAHGVFDYFHPHIISNPGVPEWWPGFCMAFDVVAGAWLFFIAKREVER